MLSTVLPKTHCRFSNLIFTALAVSLTTIASSQQFSACSLLQTSEMESALGGKAGSFKNNAIGKTSICSGEVGKRKVMIRVAERKSPDGSTEKNAVELLRKKGWKIEVKKEGNVTCSTAIPPSGNEQIGFNTTCSILSNGKVVAVEVGSSSKEDMASMEVVRSLAQKAISRM